MYACANILLPLQQVLEDTVAYTQQRTAFGKPLLNNQVIHYRIAELETEVRMPHASQEGLQSLSPFTLLCAFGALCVLWLLQLEATRSLLYRATYMYLNGADVTRLASMAKLKVGRLAREVTDSCLQFWGMNAAHFSLSPSRFCHFAASLPSRASWCVASRAGGMGYMNSSYVARMHRDMRLISIGGGADEVMLSILCKLRGTLPKSK